MQIPAKNKIPKIISGIAGTISVIALGWFSLSRFWFWVLLEIIAAVLVAVGCTGEWWLHHYPAGRKKKERDEQHKIESWFIAMVSLGVIMELFALGHSIREGVKLEDAVSKANERVEQLRSENAQLGLRLQSVIAAIPPRNISETQREKFIFVLSSEANKSPKIDVKVFVGDTNQEADNYARQFRTMLNDAGYGTNREEIIRIPKVKFSITNGLVKTIPDVVALFSSPTAAIPKTTMVGGFGSILMMRPTKITITGRGGQIDDKGAMYRYTENPNDILYGIMAVLRQYEITVWPMSGYDFVRRKTMKPGEIGFFVPAKIY